MNNPFREGTLSAGYYNFVLAHPDATHSAIARHFDVPRGRVSAAMKYLHKQNAVDRVVVGHNRTSGAPVYGYRVAGYVHEVPLAEDEPPKEEALPQPSPIGSVDLLVEQVAAQFARAIVRKMKVRLLAELELLTPTLPFEPEPDLSKYLNAVSTQDAPMGVDTSSVMEKLAEPHPVASAERKPRVGVVGLKPNQAGEISAEFHDCLDLSFWCSTDNKGFHSLEALAKNSDVVFLHSRHSSHAVDAFLVSCGANIRRIPGGVTQLKEAMLKFFAES